MIPELVITISGIRKMTAQPRLQFGTVALDPAPDCRVVRFQPALAEQFFDIAERERVPQIPAHRITSGSVCRHLKIAGRIVFFMIASVYKALLAKVATQPPRGASRHLVRGRRPRVPRLRLHRALRTPAHLRAYPRWHRRGQETRANTRPTAARLGDGFRRSENHRGRIVSRSNRKTARYWQATAYRVAKAVR